MVEKSSGYILKTLCTNNGEEFLSVQFGKYLHFEGIQHDLTVPRIPQQLRD